MTNDWVSQKVKEKLMAESPAIARTGSPNTSPRLSWAPVIATVVGTGAPPSVTAVDIARVIASPLLQELVKKDKRYSVDLYEYLQLRRDNLIRRILANQSETMEEFEARLNKKIEAVKEYRAVVLRLQANEDVVELERQRYKELSTKLLGKLSHDTPTSDIATIASWLHAIVEDTMEEVKEDCQREPPPEQSHEHKVVEFMEKEKLRDKHMRFLTRLQRDLVFCEDSMIVLIEQFDLKFRSKLAAKIASEGDLPEAELAKLLRLRDQERERMTSSARGKKDEFTVRCEEHESENLKELERVDHICVKCYGISAHLPPYYQHVGVEIDTCSLMGCNDSE